MNPEQPQIEHPEWDAKAEEISERLIGLRRRFPGQEGAGMREQIQEKIIAFARYLQKTHSDYSSYRLYHGFIGSTPPEPSTSSDFPGEDSVEQFIGRLEEEFGER